MKKLSFFLMAMLVSLTSFAAALGEGYSKVTDITTLAAGDKVVLYCDDAELGITGWDGNKTATAAATGWVEYVVEAADGGVLLKDGDNYVALTAKNSFHYTATGSVCKVTADGILYITFDSKDYLLYRNDNNGSPICRMYVDKTGNAQYKPFYVYEVTGEGGSTTPDQPTDPEPEPEPEPETPSVETVGDGTEANPFTVEDVIALNNTLSGKQYVKAYIVGQVNGASLAAGAEFEAPFTPSTNSSTGVQYTYNTNLLIASSADETDPAKCVPVQLPSGDVRTNFNLPENPDMDGKLVLINGDLIKYFTVPGIKNTVSIVVLEEEVEEPTEPETPDTPDTTEEPEAKVITVAEFIAAPEAKDVYYELTGTIGGTINTTYGNFDLTDETGTVYVYGLTKEFIAVGSTQNDKSYSSLGLKEGDKITIRGFRGSYNGKIEVMGAYFVKLVEAGETPEPETPSVETVGDGTEANPFTVEDVIALNNTLSGKQYVKAYIVGQVNGASLAAGAEFEAPFTPSTNSSTGVQYTYNTNLLIASSADETDPAKCVPVQLPSGDVRTNFNLPENPDMDGKLVLINGDLIKYFTVPGIKNTVSIVVVEDSSTPTGLDNLDATVAPVKAIRNGQLIIIRNGVEYNANGAILK